MKKVKSIVMKVLAMMGENEVRAGQRIFLVGKLSFKRIA